MSASASVVVGGVITRSASQLDPNVIMTTFPKQGRIPVIGDQYRMNEAGVECKWYVEHGRFKEFVIVCEPWVVSNFTLCITGKWKDNKHFVVNGQVDVENDKHDLIAHIQQGTANQYTLRLDSVKCPPFWLVIPIPQPIHSYVRAAIKFVEKEQHLSTLAGL